MKTTDSILAELAPIFREVLKAPNLELQLSDTADSVANWDSLNHVVLLSAIEKHFGMQFSMRDTLALETVGDICDLILRKTQSSH